MDSRMMVMFRSIGMMVFAGLALAGCARMPIASAPVEDRSAIEAALKRDIGVLASDEYGGRKPGTPGEALTTEFIVSGLQAAGFESGTNDPGNPWRAPVSLVSSYPESSRIVLTSSDSTEFELAAEDAVAFISLQRELVEGAAMVFVGKLSDEVSPDTIAGKVVVMLGEPGVSPGRRETLFAMNPSAILTVVDDENAIANTRRGLVRERIVLASEEGARLTGFVTQATMAQVLGEALWSQLLDRSELDDFKPVPLNSTATIEATSQRREFTSANVIGRLAGAVPNSGAVLMLGHWDHLGECRDEGATDRICNGAVDNASGIAVMLELARRLAASGPHDRDIYVLATTAEESGLLGAKAFTEGPPIPLDTIVGAFNFDTTAIAPAGSAVGLVGRGRTPLDDVISQVMLEAKREPGDDAFANSFIQRQDGWVLLQKDVPSVMLSTAFSSREVLGDFLTGDYHRPSDEIESIELGGAIDDLLLHEALIKRIANTALYPAPGASDGG
ncbi:MAG: M20/M25/M40 family metallo-hydrolase [Pseudomonadota bacterium]